jgi:D-tyrosyl-tRNA(Tyr) deacylase
LFERFVEQARATGLKVATGRFQQYMQVEIHNDGPVTILLDSREKF